MARCDGCLAGSWFWHDPLADPHAYAYLFHATCLTGYWFYRDYLCQGFRAE